mgnify:CR=1 FL=1
MVERARLESEYTGNRIGGSNPPLSANYLFHQVSRSSKNPRWSKLRPRRTEFKTLAQVEPLYASLTIIVTIRAGA